MITRRGSRSRPGVSRREPDAPSPAHHRTSDYVLVNKLFAHTQGEPPDFD